MSSPSFTGRHGALFGGSGKTATFSKPIQLLVGLVVVSALQPLVRKYHAPNPVQRPDFHITDMEVYTPDGTKILIEFLGKDRAALLALAVT
jgi:hypothetical protein